MSERSIRGSTRRVTRSESKRKEDEKRVSSGPPVLFDTTMDSVLTSETMVPKDKPASKHEEGSQTTRASSNRKLLLQQIKEEEELIERKLALVKRRNELIAAGSETASSSGSSMYQQKRIENWVINAGTTAVKEEAVAAAQRKGELLATPSTSRKPTKAQLTARQSKLSDLPKFEGSQTAWASFISNFNRTTEMCGYNNDENLTRLNKCLEGKARETVECLLMHPENVPMIIDTLRLVFGQPVRIIHELTNKISSLPSIPEGKFEEVVDLAVKVRNYCATVEVCNLKGYQNNETLLHKITNKLPPTLRLRWAEFPLEKDEVSLQTFSSWIGNIAKTASTITPSSANIVRPSNDRKGLKGSFVNTHAEQAPQASTAAKASNICVVCKGSCASVDRCARFAELSGEGRWAVVKEKQLCRKCLRQHKGFCKRLTPCGVEGCTFKHHSLLHRSKPQNQETPERQCNVHHNNENNILFRMIPVRVYGRNVSVDTYAFMDDGSEITLMDESLADELQLEGPHKSLCLKWANHMRHHEEASKTVSIKLSGKGNEIHSLHAIQTVKGLDLPKQTLNMNSLIKKYPYLAHTPVESYRDAKPRILIGLDNARLSTVKKSREGGRNQPVAGKTRLGWTVYGYCGNERGASSSTPNYYLQVRKCECNCDDTLYSAMKEYFALDSIGIDKSSPALLSKEGERSLQILSQQSRLIDKRYECGLLWKYDNVRLPESKAMAINRWKCLERKVTTDKELAIAMQTKIQEYMDNQYIRKLTPAEMNENHKRVRYLPMFPVSNPNKPGKFRIVWDAAAKAHGISLNSVLLKGPDQLSSLPSILMKFRQNRIGITGDIREMFHQVRINKEDQHCQRFLWKPDISSGAPTEYVMCVMTFGAACSPSTAQIIKNLNARRFENQYPDATKVILEQHYVDDMLISVESEEEAIKLAKEVKCVHSEGGFEIRNWLSNSKAVLDELNGDKTTEKSLNIGLPLPTEKVLGMYWCT
ncbi:uncharacterized protein LOC125774390 [Anopheles funestus]|uniref:uncharacterized protein LOC125774390 n=1 Tax=Anopheles funestus TaxID=62324 RepID=UPI0020C66FA2|nr:uncharacterized protein LOC125774390 [Anopheles funestus]